MAEEIAFENGRISNFEGLVTLTLDRVILHTVMHHSPTSTYMLSIQISIILPQYFYFSAPLIYIFLFAHCVLLLLHVHCSPTCSIVLFGLMTTKLNKYYLLTCKISLKSNKLSVDGRTDVRTYARTDGRADF